MKILKLFFTMIMFNVTSFGQETNPLEFFPSNVGDQWQYSVQGGGIVDEIIYKDSVDADGSKYLFYKISNAIGEPFIHYRLKFKLDTQNRVYFRPQFPELYYKLDADIGDTWWVINPDSTTHGEKALVTNISNRIVLGRETTVKRIEYYKMGEGDTVINENSFYLTTREIAAGFGRIFEDKDAVQPDFLIGCVIADDTFGVVTDIKEILSPKVIPNDIELKQNYPNPFNPVTTISYQLPKKGQVSLKIYNSLGKEIKELVNNYQGEGSYSVKFDGSELPSGVYFYKITAGTYTDTKKLILMK